MSRTEHRAVADKLEALQAALQVCKSIRAVAACFMRFGGDHLSETRSEDGDIKILLLRFVDWDTLILNGTMISPTSQLPLNCCAFAGYGSTYRASRRG